MPLTIKFSTIDGPNNTKKHSAFITFGKAELPLIENAKTFTLTTKGDTIFIDLFNNNRGALRVAQYTSTKSNKKRPYLNFVQQKWLGQIFAAGKFVNIPIEIVTNNPDEGHVRIKFQNPGKSGGVIEKPVVNRVVDIETVTSTHVVAKRKSISRNTAIELLSKGIAKISTLTLYGEEIDIED